MTLPLSLSLSLPQREPLISERSLIGFVTGVPNKIENVLCRMVSADDIEEIEKKLAAVREVEEKCRFGIDPKDLIDEEMVSWLFELIRSLFHSLPSITQKAPF